MSEPRRPSSKRTLKPTRELTKAPTGILGLDEVTGGSPYGATTITGGDGSRQPSENELAGARYQGRVIAETARKLHG